MGRCAFSETSSLIDYWHSRTKPFCKVEYENSRDAESVPHSLRNRGTEQFVVALDESGKQYKSKEFADQIQAWIDNPSIKSLAFVVGGAHGLPPQLRAEADAKVALSNFTLQGDVATIVLLEQIYRAFNILKGTGYHHE